MIDPSASSTFLNLTTIFKILTFESVNDLLKRERDIQYNQDQIFWKASKRLKGQKPEKGLNLKREKIEKRLIFKQRIYTINIKGIAKGTTCFCYVHDSLGARQTFNHYDWLKTVPAVDRLPYLGGKPAALTDPLCIWV
jgi:hypothetical protein